MKIKLTRYANNINTRRKHDTCSQVEWTITEKPGETIYELETGQVYIREHKGGECESTSNKREI